MASILYHADKKRNVHFYILSCDVTDKNKKKLATLNKIKPCSIEYPQFDEKMLDIFDEIKMPAHVSKMTYARILIPDIISDVEKVIFIDSDTVVQVDIGELYDIDLAENYFGMVEDANWKNLSKQLWGDIDNCYYNAGVLLINAKKLREVDYISLIEKQIRKNKARYQICDQDVINDTFVNRILKLSLTWNCHHEPFAKKYKLYTPDNVAEFEKICSNPNIIHYVGVSKPWLASISHRFKKEYYFYKSLTSFRHYFEYQKYFIKSFNEKTRALLFLNKKIFLKTNKNGVKQVILLGCDLSRFKMVLTAVRKRIISSEYSQFLYTLKFLGLPCIIKRNAPDIQYIKIWGIPIYYKADRNFHLLEMQRKLHQQVAELQRKADILNNNHAELRTVNQLLARKLSNMKCIVEAQNLHKISFASYRNAFAGKDVVLVCTGPTAKKYKPIDGAVHVGVNGAVYLEHVALDYLFVQDNTVRQTGNNSLNDDADKYAGNNCKKFYGIIPDDRLAAVRSDIERIAASRMCLRNVSAYVLEDIPHHNVAYDIAREPLGDFSGTPFSALQFILYTNPKRLYLVGWDCGAGYAYDKRNAMKPANYQVEILKKHFLPFIKVHYSDIEIISINPVGLKGIFKDIYTK